MAALFDPREVTVKERFEELDGERSSVLKRAEDSAALTTPYIFPKESQTEQSDLDIPYQSFGSKISTDLGTKLMDTLFPSNSAFFKFSPDAETSKALSESEDSTQKDEITELYSRAEAETMAELERRRYRMPTLNSLNSLIVTGNSLLWENQEDGVFTEVGLREYVVSRDQRGEVLEIIVKQTVDAKFLEDTTGLDIEDDEAIVEVDVFTRLVWDGEVYHYYQEIQEEEQEGSETFKRSPEVPLPFIVLRYTSLNGENYGRGHVEKYIGDLRTYESLNIAMVDYISAIARLIYLVNPDGVTDVADLQDAEIGRASCRERV